MPGSILNIRDGERNKAANIPALIKLPLELWGERVGKGCKLLNKQMKKYLSVNL